MITRYARVRAALWMSLLVLSVGVGMRCGVDVGLIAGGLLSALLLLLATETDEPEKKARRR